MFLTKAAFRSAFFMCQLWSNCPGQDSLVLPALAPDGDLLALDLALAKRLDDAVSEVFGNLDKRETVGDVDVANLTAGQTGFARDRADQILRPDTRGTT